MGKKKRRKRIINNFPLFPSESHAGNAKRKQRLFAWSISHENKEGIPPPPPFIFRR